MSTAKNKRKNPVTEQLQDLRTEVVRELNSVAQETGSTLDALASSGKAGYLNYDERASNFSDNSEPSAETMAALVRQFQRRIGQTWPQFQEAAIIATIQRLEILGELLPEAFSMAAFPGATTNAIANAVTMLTDYAGAANAVARIERDSEGKRQADGAAEQMKMVYSEAFDAGQRAMKQFLIDQEKEKRRARRTAKRK